MDPLSIAASVAGLAGLTLEAASVVTTYVKAVKDAPKSVQEITQELVLTQAVLGKLDKFLRSQSIKTASFDPSSVLPVAIGLCNETSRDILDSLQSTKQNGALRVLEKLKWPFTEKQTQKRLDALRRCTATFQFSLTVEGCNLLSRTSEDVTKTLELQLYTSRKVLDLTAEIGTLSTLATEALKSSTQIAQILQLISSFHNTSGALKSLSDNVDILASRSQAVQEEQILDWLSPKDYSRKHRDVRARRLSGTGQWLLNCDTFQAWLSRGTPVLSCTGNPGVGKSVLTSLVIDHIRDNPKPQLQGLAYFYFDYVERAVQTPTILVGSIVRQLVSQTRFFPQPLMHFYHRFKEDESHGSTPELLLILKGICKSFEKCFIIIDALDECQKSYRREVLQILNDLDKDSIQLFVTSRPHSHDIKQHFRKTENIEVAASEADIRRYCLRMIDENDNTRELMGEKLRIDVADSVSRNAQGLFLLPVLQMQFILEAMTRAEIRNSIRNLSADLGEAFKDTVRRIDGEPQNRRKVAKQSLMWISHACRPLKIHELRYALATQTGEKEFDMDNVLQARFIVECCLGLVLIDESSSVVRLVHHTLQDYLHSQRQGLFQSEETEMTKACLTYLCFENLPATELDEGGLLGYAAAHWGHHAVHAFGDEVDDLALAFLTDRSKLARAEQYLQLNPPQRSELAWHREIRVNRMTGREGTCGLHVAAAFGLARITRLLLNTGLGSNIQDSRGNTALHEAACNGQIEAASVLLGRGAYPNLANFDDNTALYLAVSFDYKDLVLLLLRHGADPDVRCVDGWTATHEACDKGHVEILEILVNHGASIRSQSARGLIGLHRASGRGHLRIIQLLLNRGSEVDAKTKDEWTPLHGASSSGQYEAVRVLLGNGASIDHQSRDGRTPLHRSSRGGHYLTVAMLLSKGANHLLTDSGNNLPIHRAAKGGHMRIAKLLLNHDPTTRSLQLSAQHVNLRTPRAEASYCGHWKTASMLREAEVLHHRSNSDNRSAIDIAVEEGDLKQVEELLSSGLDINKLNPDGITPLHQAFLMGNERLAELLICNNASFNAKTSDGWLPLHCAAKKGIESAVRLCLNHGADVSSPTNDGQTALHKVCKSGVLQTTKLIIDRGADLEARDFWGWRPIHTASAAGFQDLVELLISEGADTEARDKNGRTPQACAAGAGHHTLVEYLRTKRPRAESVGSRNTHPTQEFGLESGATVLVTDPPAYIPLVQSKSTAAKWEVSSFE